jgi:hypothetical protein
VRRAVRRGEEPIAAARSARERWHEAHDAGLAREPGPDWRAYWAGGVDEADELVDSLTAG